MAISFFKQKALLSSMSFALALTIAMPMQAQANSSMRNEMNKMFGSMSNVTAPGVFETSRRGVISGGSIVVRNKVMNTSMIAFQPPSFSAGCGGIDMFGGSFSFINKEQFVQLARSVASNAAGYAFYLALDVMAPSVRTIMDGLQAKIQELNQFLGNSCQMAQGLVDGGIAAIESKKFMDSGTLKSFKEGFGDAFEGITGHGGSPPTKDVSASTKKFTTGNIVWNALQDNNVSNWFTYGGDNLNLAIMTLTGTYIIGEERPAPDGKGDSAPHREIPSGLTTQNITFSALVHGGDIRIYACDETEKCLNPNTANPSAVTIEGFKEMILRTLNGKDGSPGVLGKIRAGDEPTASEKSFISALPGGMGGMIFRMSRVSDHLAREFAIKIAEPLGREMAFELLKSFSDAAITAASTDSMSAGHKEGLKVLKEGRMALQREYETEVSKGLNLADIVTTYNNLLQAAQRKGVSPDYNVPPTTNASSN